MFTSKELSAASMNELKESLDWINYILDEDRSVGFGWHKASFDLEYQMEYFELLTEYPPKVIEPSFNDGLPF